MLQQRLENHMQDIQNSLQIRQIQSTLFVQSAFRRSQVQNDSSILFSLINHTGFLMF